MNGSDRLPGQLQRQLAGQGRKILDHIRWGGVISDEVDKFLVEEFVTKALAWPQLAEIADRHTFDAGDLRLIYTSIVEHMMPNPVVWYGADVLLPTITFVEHDELNSALLRIGNAIGKADGANRQRAIVEAAGVYADEIAAVLDKRPMKVINAGGMSMRVAKGSSGCLKIAKFLAVCVAAFMGVAGWCFFNARVDYSWAAKITEEKRMEGWTLAATQDNFADMVRPWTWFKTPVTGLWFTKPNELLQNGDIVAASILRVSYNYSATEQEEYLEFFDVKSGKSAFVPENTPAGEVDHRTLDWHDYSPGTPGEQLIRFVQTAIRNR